MTTMTCFNAIVFVSTETLPMLSPQVHCPSLLIQLAVLQISQLSDLPALPSGSFSTRRSYTSYDSRGPGRRRPRRRGSDEDWERKREADREWERTIFTAAKSALYYKHSGKAQDERVVNNATIQRMKLQSLQRDILFAVSRTYHDPNDEGFGRWELSEVRDLLKGYCMS